MRSRKCAKQLAERGPCRFLAVALDCYIHVAILSKSQGAMPQRVTRVYDRPGWASNGFEFASAEP